MPSRCKIRWLGVELESVKGTDRIIRSEDEARRTLNPLGVHEGQRVGREAVSVGIKIVGVDKPATPRLNEIELAFGARRDADPGPKFGCHPAAAQDDPCKGPGAGIAQINRN